MPDIQAQFDKAAVEVKELPARPDDETLLKLYALYKQATTGDVSGDRPGMLNLVGRAKYDAWAKVKGTSKDKSMKDYVRLVKKLQDA